MKALKQKVGDKSLLKTMSNDLSALLRLNHLGPGDHSAEQLRSEVDQHINAFCDKYAAESNFIGYFKQYWAHRPGAALNIQKIPIFVTYCSSSLQILSQVAFRQLR